MIKESRGEKKGRWKTVSTLKRKVNEIETVRKSKKLEKRSTKKDERLEKVRRKGDQRYWYIKEKSWENLRGRAGSRLLRIL